VKRKGPQLAARLRGPSGFIAFYEREWGDRFPALREALGARAGTTRGRVIRENAFAEEKVRQERFGSLALGPLSGTREFARDAGADSKDSKGLTLGYVMDPASIEAARALPLHGAKTVLDLCAAPGGKSLVLAEGLDPEADLFLNDRSSDRLARLRQVVQDYTPSSVASRIHVTGHDGRRVGLGKREAFDRILLDAPCSSEGHVLADPHALEQWSESRVERLAQDQYALVTAAIDALRPGGSLLYSTCALARRENDDVIQRVLDRSGRPVQVAPLPPSHLGSLTVHGRQILPDEQGFGPIYYSLLHKMP
jgi:5-methylcytosine rRNA methyltransferase NSUN4